MSELILLKFDQRVPVYFQNYCNHRALALCWVEEEGMARKVELSGSGGSVEIRCGPPEYRAEIFINGLHGQRWGRSDLMAIDGVEVRMEHSRPLGLDSLFEDDVAFVFRLIVEGLKGVAGFEWLHEDRQDVGNFKSLPPEPELPRRIMQRPPTSGRRTDRSAIRSGRRRRQPYVTPGEGAGEDDAGES